MSSPLLEVEDLCKSFQTGDGRIDVLQGVHLSVGEGERLAILGQSGVGKSTLLHILGTLDRPTSGSVRFRGEDAFDRSPEDLASFRNRCLGFVFQFHHLLPEFDAVENVMMPGLLRRLEFAEMRDRAVAILEDVGLGHRLRHRVGKLSGGERQRVALARALVLDPALVLADEPTGNLDPQLARDIMDIIADAHARGTTVMVATHDPTLLEQYRHRRLVLEGGRLVKDHAPDGYPTSVRRAVLNAP
jgi:lipoprotein-releasing system ATP-binding protein